MSIYTTHNNSIHIKYISDTRNDDDNISYIDTRSQIKMFIIFNNFNSSWPDIFGQHRMDIG